MPNVVLWSDQIALATGVVLSLALSYIPGLRGVYDPLPADWKRVIFALLSLACAVGIYVVFCTELIPYSEAEAGVALLCPSDGLLGVLGAWVEVLIAGQATYMLSPGVHRD